MASRPQIPTAPPPPEFPPPELPPPEPPLPPEGGALMTRLALALLLVWLTSDASELATPLKFADPALPAL